jgi:hypothetical protein
MRQFPGAVVTKINIGHIGTASPAATPASVPSPRPVSQQPSYPLGPTNPAQQP